MTKFYNKELKATIKAVTSMIEPLMIIFMGGIVGFIAMSIILPIFKMSQLVETDIPIFETPPRPSRVDSH